MKVIGIRVESRDGSQFVLEALKTAVERGRVTLEDVAFVTKDDAGKVHVHQTKDATPGKGAGRGALVGALVGLAAPPLLGAAALGAGLGALWGKFRDRGIDDDLMKEIGGMIESGEAVVFALGDDASIDAVVARAQELGIGQVMTFTLDQRSEELVREAAEHLPEMPPLTSHPLQYS